MTVANRFWTLALTLCALAGAGCTSRARQPLALVPASRPAIPEPPPSHLTSYRLPVTPELALPPQPSFDPVEDVIQQAEAAFTRGQEAYLNGHLELAKREFNAAIAFILQSPVPASEDRRIQKTFDSLVDRIHTYEVAALKQGDGFAEPGYQPAPIDDLQTLTFTEDSQATKLLGSNSGSILEIPLVMNSQVESSIKYFTQGRGRYTLEAALRRSGRYRDMIFRVMEEEGVPKDLIYLAQIESGFQPRARSYAAAVGMWQFLAWRGKEYGLDRTWWEDERMDPEKATRAAARHLRDLYNQFGDWYLAMAAYHCGPVCISRGVERSGYADFWELSRRRLVGPQTRSYIPVIIALIIISKNPEKYGIEDLVLEPSWTYDTVTVTSPVDLRLVAEMAETSLETIRELNPNLLRLTTPKVPEYTLRVPLASRELFLKRVAMIPEEKRVFWRWHTVRHGESLSSIAKQFKTTAKAIAEVNNLDASQPIWEAAELVIPVGGSGAGGSGPLALPGERHTVARGETLSIIGRRFNVSTAQLMDWNELDDTLIRIGQRLLVAPLDGPEPTAASAPPRQAEKPASTSTTRIASTMASNGADRTPATETGRLIHRVRRGESLSVIATNYKTSVAALRRNNQHLGRILQVGDPVYIPNGR